MRSRPAPIAISLSAWNARAIIASPWCEAKRSDERCGDWKYTWSSCGVSKFSVLEGSTYMRSARALALPHVVDCCRPV